MSFVATLLTFLLPETLPIEKRSISKPSEKQESIIKELIQSFHKPYFHHLLLILVMTFGLVSFETVYSLFVEDKYGFTSRDVSILITMGATIGIIVQVGLIDKAIRRFGEYNLIRFSLLITGIALLFMLIKVNFIYLIVVSSVFFAFNSFLRPTVTTLLSNEVGSNEQGFVSGLNTTYTSMGNIVGPIMAGSLFDKQINLPYIMSAFILFGTIFLTKQRKYGYIEKVVENE